jgi:hypothetical protein
MTMKHFTPVRWVQLQDVATEASFRAAHAEWEEALADYRHELDAIRPRLVDTLRRFADAESLHDALLVAGWRESKRLTLLVKPEPPSDRYVVLTYTLTGEPGINPSALPPEYRTEHATWMYDEISIEGDVFVHSILMSNGVEITVRFDHFEVARPEALFLARLPDTVGPLTSLPQSA